MILPWDLGTKDLGMGGMGGESRGLAYKGCLMVAGYGSSDFIRMRLKDPRLSNTMDFHDFRGWSSWNLQVTFVLQAAPRLTSKILILSDF